MPHSINFLPAGTEGVGIILDGTDSAPLKAKIIGYYFQYSANVKTLPPENPGEEWFMLVNLANGAAKASFKCSEIRALLPPTIPPKPPEDA